MFILPFSEKESTCLFFQFYLLRNMTSKKKSLLFKVKMVDDDVEININSLINLFLEDSPFEPYIDEVYGIATHNYQLKIYNVAFKETFPKKILKDVYNAFYETEIIPTKENVEFSNQVNCLLELIQIDTLYPMPFDISYKTI